jgi:hypothetical protein
MENRAWHTEREADDKRTEPMLLLQVMLVLSDLVLVCTVIVFRWTRDRSAVDSSSCGVGSAVSSWPVGTSMLSYRGSSPAGLSTASS